MTDAAQPGGEQDGALRLLALLADDATVAEVAAVPAPAAARELAVRVAAAREVHQRREAGLSALLETARALASESDTAQVLDAIVRRARALLGTDLTYLTLHDPEHGDTYMRATDGSVSAAFQSVRLELGAGLGGLVASTRKPYWTADYWNDERFVHTSDIDGAVSEEGIIAICGTPLLVENTFVGVLFAANRTPRPFTREEVALLGNLATLAAVTLVQTRALADAESALAALSEAHETVRQYADGIEKAAAAHDRFASLVLGGGGTEDLTHALADLLGGWAALVDEDGTVRSTTPGAVVPEDFPDLRAGRLVTRDGVHGLAVATGDEHLATLYVGGTGDLTDADRRTVERAGVVTALVLLFERQAADSRQAARNRVVAELLAARGPAQDRVQLVRTTGADPEAPNCLLVLRGDATSSTRALALSASAAAGEGGLVGVQDGDVVALVPGGDAGALARSMATRVGRRGDVTVAGVGPLTGVDAIPAAHEEATRTVAALVALGRRGEGAAATQLGFAGLIVGSDPDVSAYVTHELGALLDYDARRGTDLVGTLAAWFAAGRSPRHAATRLHVHVNTVAQRLDRIGALLGEGWQEPERSLELQLALRMRDLLAAD
ncbi:helix-turn-helix domain-containing protein [Phycicoccus sp. MAQZ13P-2]|uniref:helix-turn-helix domain-containing protein n=1 Tax=Phycicoccus mangrovi TaxID=2840470 RepID=UPI001C003959|nr:helix-turn-helix domain-containing protein [Phycicoccus mangrovi]MBT9256970.1 helix-turn-helix domain-containing protein [Phycicoccus mangrovi]MBT9274881.1 helix-turn-helix domain-containing protein [Phycicoccus mangrovi]